MALAKAEFDIPIRYRGIYKSSIDTSIGTDHKGFYSLGNTMTAVQKRLEIAMKLANMSQSELARRVGIKQSSVNAFLNKSKTEDWAHLVRAARALGVRAEWLQFGENPMKSSANGAVATQRLESGVIEIGRSEFTAIPRYDAKLSAGPGCIADPNAEPLGFHLVEAQWLRTVTRAMPDNLAVLRVDGDSMTETLHDGDWVLVDRTQKRLNREGIYALQVGDSVWVKRVTLNLREQLVRVISDNTRYPVQELAEDDLAPIGRVVWVVGRKIV